MPGKTAWGTDVMHYRDINKIFLACMIKTLENAC